jgi:hypothetical protein
MPESWNWHLYLDFIQYSHVSSVTAASRQSVTVSSIIKLPEHLWWQMIHCTRNRVFCGGIIRLSLYLTCTTFWEVDSFPVIRWSSVEFEISQRWLWRVSSSGTWRRVVRCVNRRFGGTYRLHIQCLSHLLACWFLAEFISSTLKMEAICSSETSVDTQRITRRYIPEDDTL